MTYWHTNSLNDHKHLDDLHAAQGSIAKTLAHLTGYDGKWSTSMQRLAKDAGVSKPTAVEAVKQLEQRGLVSRHREGRRSATVYTWHSCPPGCNEGSHTGKKDRRASRFLYGAVVAAEAVKIDQPETKPLSKRKRRAQAQSKVMASLSKPTEWSSEPVSGQVSGQLALPPKDKTRLKRESETELASGQVSGQLSADTMTQYAALYLDVEALANSDYVDALTAEVLLDLLNDPETWSTVTALAVELWGAAIPSPLTFEQVEQLRGHFETRTGFDTRGHYMAIHRYGTQGDTVTPWRELPQATKDKWLRQYAYATAAMQVSEVARSVKQTAPGYSFPPAEEQKRQLLDSFERLNRVTASE